MPTIVTPYSTIGHFDEGNFDSPLNRSGELKKLSRSEDSELRAARCFSTSPKAEGDRVLEIRNNLTDITNRLNNFDKEKLALQVSKIEALIELYRSSGEGALTREKLIEQIDEFLISVDQTKNYDRKFPITLYKWAKFAHDTTLSRGLSDRIASKALSISQNNNLTAVAVIVKELMNANEQEYRKIMEYFRH